MAQGAVSHLTDGNLLSYASFLIPPSMCGEMTTRARAWLSAGLDSIMPLTQTRLLEAALLRLSRHVRWFSGVPLRTVSDGIDEPLQSLDEVVTVARRHALQHWLEGLDLQHFEFLDESLPLSSQLQDVHTPVSGVGAARQKLLLHEAVHDLGDGWQRDIKRFRDLTHMAARMLCDIE